MVLVVFSNLGDSMIVWSRRDQQVGRGARLCAAVGLFELAVSGTGQPLASPHRGRPCSIPPLPKQWQGHPTHCPGRAMAEKPGLEHVVQALVWSILSKLYTCLVRLCLTVCEVKLRKQRRIKFAFSVGNDFSCLPC